MQLYKVYLSLSTVFLQKQDFTSDFIESFWLQSCNLPFVAGVTPLRSQIAGCFWVAIVV
jgi:hypothetical protein